MKQIITFAKTSAAAIVLAVLGSPVSAQPAQPTLEKAIAFEQGTAFEVKEESNNIFDAMWQSDQIDLPELGLRRISHSEPDQKGWVRNEMQVGADWNGLYLTKLGYDGLENSGVGAYRMHFSDNVNVVQRKLASLGMKTDSLTDDSYCDMDVKVRPETGGSVLYVSFIC